MNGWWKACEAPLGALKSIFKSEASWVLFGISRMLQQCEFHNVSTDHNEKLFGCKLRMFPGGARGILAAQHGHVWWLQRGACAPMAGCCCPNISKIIQVWSSRLILSGIARRDPYANDFPMIFQFSMVSFLAKGILLNFCKAIKRGATSVRVGGGLAPHPPHPPLEMARDFGYSGSFPKNEVSPVIIHL